MNGRIAIMASAMCWMADVSGVVCSKSARLSIVNTPKWVELDAAKLQPKGGIRNEKLVISFLRCRLMRNSARRELAARLGRYL